MSKHVIKSGSGSARYFSSIGFSLAKVLLNILPPSIEVFFHREFGERYLGRIGISFVLFVFYCQLFSSAPEIARDSSEQFFLGLYLLCFLGLSIFHLVEFVVRRKYVGGAVHSRSSGVPWSVWHRFGFSPVAVQRYVEPGLCFLAALVLQFFAKVLAFWLITSAVALFVKCQIQAWTARGRILDAIDGRIEAQKLNATVQRRIAPRHHGAGRFFHVAPGHRAAGGGRKHP